MESDGIVGFYQLFDTGGAKKKTNKIGTWVRPLHLRLPQAVSVGCGSKPWYLSPKIADKWMFITVK